MTTPAAIDFSRLFGARSIAVVGASADEKTPSGQPLMHLRNLGYSGEVYPVNPRYEAIGQWRCYPSVSALPDSYSVQYSGSVTGTGSLGGAFTVSATGVGSLGAECVQLNGTASVGYGAEAWTVLIASYDRCAGGCPGRSPPSAPTSCAVRW